MIKKMNGYTPGEADLNRKADTLGGEQKVKNVKSEQATMDKAGEPDKAPSSGLKKM